MFEEKNYVHKAREFRDVINKLRRKPKSFIPDLKRWWNSIGTCIPNGDKQPRMVQHEEAKTIVEAIYFLDNVKPIKEPLEVSVSLSKAAQDHAQDCTDNEIGGHTGSDESTLRDRVNKYVTHAEKLGECGTYHNFDHARDGVIDLLILGGLGEEDQRK